MNYVLIFLILFSGGLFAQAPTLCTKNKKAIELYVESLQQHGEEIPTESDVFEYTLTLPAHA